MTKEFITKDNKEHKEFSSGMKRDTEEAKPRFDLILPEGQRYDETLLYRWAMLMQRGAKKYAYRNWEKANSIEELERFKSGTWRHFIQAMSGEVDEDHFSAVCFGLNGIIYLMDKLKVDIHGNKIEEENIKK